MSTIGNILWFLLIGVWQALVYLLAGLVLCVTIIGIPFGIQAFKLARFVLWPFGRTVVPRGEGSVVLQTVFNVIWLVLFGWELFLASLVSALLLAVTIIGLPFAWQAVKIGVLGLWPFGQVVVRSP
jgi:uncharacterized membrane protein YccF (DUF307 family)